jgi:3-methyladenine DNA glycosylase AlkC
LLAALPEECDPTLSDNDFGDFIYAPFCDFIAKHNESKRNLKFSLEALRQTTTRFSAEDSIRYFINFDPKETLQTMLRWTNDTHYHVRRLASEGSRPKPPWSQKILINVEETLPILDQLFSDRTRYVTRSVANHLNDISKTHPELVIQTLKRWQASQKQTAEEMQYITKHALRTLIKLGYPSAFSLLGFGSDVKVKLTKLELKKNQLKLGEPLEFEVTLLAEQDGPLLVDYTIYFPSKTAGKLNKKVYKLTTVQAQKNQPISIQKKHPLRPNMTTRKIYPGTHSLEIQVNGSKLDTIQFEIIQ